jgi:hypothetical protein
MKPLLNTYPVHLLLITLVWGIASSQHRDVVYPQVEAVGTVVAYDLLPDPTLRHGNPKRLSYDLVVRVEHLESPTIRSKYILVRYEYWQTEADLPREFYDPSITWRLRLLREEKCDRSLPEDTPLVRNGKEVGRVPAFRRPPGTENEKLPSKSILPCYLLHAGEFNRIISPGSD